ncbi:hypothetical protein LXA43DRAFT_1097488 [Ganoderma leucocontextum]|nr:hypothetical protein LXA43DRAFT_1097488 [Ganoderma leucocontextum]
MSQPPTTGPAQLPAQQPGGDNARALADSQGLATSMHTPQPAPSSQQQQSPAPSNWAGSVMDFDPFDILGDAPRSSQAKPFNEELTRTSERARPGRPDPSVENNPHSNWYAWHRSSSAGTRPLPVMAAWARDAHLPTIAIKSMGPEAERIEAECVSQAKHNGKGPKPTRRNHQPSDFGHWAGVEIITVTQAHNLRRCAIYDDDIYAVRLYRHLNSLFQSDLTLHRSQGIQYLIRSFSDDTHRMAFERGSSTSSSCRLERKHERSKAVNTAHSTAGDAPTPLNVDSTATLPALAATSTAAMRCKGLASA